MTGWKLGVVMGSLDLGGLPVVNINRHGVANLLPHQIDYVANMTYLKDHGVTHVLALHTVGGIDNRCTPGTFVIPHDFIDYTRGRNQVVPGAERHIDVTDLFDGPLRGVVVRSLAWQQVRFRRGILAVTEGPRLESPSEINRLEADGCCVVGMTAMPEAVVARALGMKYASLCLVVNRAAGRTESDGELSDQMMGAVRDAARDVVRGLIKSMVDQR